MSLPPAWLLPRGIFPARPFTTSARRLNPPRPSRPGAGGPSHHRPARNPSAPFVPPSNLGGPRKPSYARDASKPRRHVRPPLLGMEYWSGGKDAGGSKPVERPSGGAGEGRPVERPSGVGESEAERERALSRLTDAERDALTQMEMEMEPEDLLVGRVLGKDERKMSVAFTDEPFLGLRDSPVTISELVAKSNAPSSEDAQPAAADLTQSSDAKRRNRKPEVPGVWMSPRPIDEPVHKLLDDIVRHGQQREGQHGRKRQEEQEFVAPKVFQTIEGLGLSWMGLLKNSGRKMRFIGLDLDSVLPTVQHDKHAGAHSHLFVLRALPVQRVPPRPYPPFPNAHETALRVRCENPCVHVAFVTPKATVSKLAVERNRVRRLLKVALERVADSEDSWQYISPELAYIFWVKPEVYMTPVEQIVPVLQKALKQVKARAGPQVQYGWGARSPPINFRKKDRSPQGEWRDLPPWNEKRWLFDDERAERQQSKMQDKWNARVDALVEGVP
ncbi:hypothetical protein IAT38_001816 [Cryptococcus sp. DSM 104549]